MITQNEFMDELEKFSPGISKRRLDFACMRAERLLVGIGLGMLEELNKLNIDFNVSKMTNMLIYVLKEKCGITNYFLPNRFTEVDWQNAIDNFKSAYFNSLGIKVEVKEYKYYDIWIVKKYIPTQNKTGY